MENKELKKKLVKAEKEIDKLRESESALENKVDELKEECNKYSNKNFELDKEVYYLEGRLEEHTIGDNSLNDQMKRGLLEANWESITVEMLENLVKNV